MISKRSFFKKLSAVIAAVAIAPEIAFGAKLELPQAQWKWGTYANMNGYAAQMEERAASFETRYLSELIISEWEKNHA